MGNGAWFGSKDLQIKRERVVGRVVSCKGKVKGGERNEGIVFGRV